MDHDQLIIGGVARAGAGASFDIIDPRDATVSSQVRSADEAQVAAAIAAANEARRSWAALSQDDRSAALDAIAADVEAHREELIDVVTLETGRTRARNAVYVDWTAFLFRQYAVLARFHRGRVVPSNTAGQLSMVLRAPIGVIGCLTPYNYPLALLVHKVAPALAVGNTVVVKGAEETTRTTLMLGEIMARHVPQGVVNAVAGGVAVGSALVDGDTHMIAFTGSTGAGRAIGSRCADLVKPAHLELGGKDAAIVCADADMDTAVAGVVWAAFLNTGQVCTSTERVYVDAAIAPEFTERVAAATAALRVGDPFAAATQVGPLRTEQNLHRTLTHIDQAVGAGATIVAGGSRIDGPGYYLAPTALTGVDHSMAIMTDETFGPALPIMEFGGIDEAFELASATPYGLGASLYTHDARIVKRAFEELDVGTVWVNDPVVDNPAAPFGGMRASGSGRELGLEALDTFTIPRHVHWDIDGGIKPWWYVD